MLAPEDFLAALKQSGVQFFAGVPDSLLKDFIGLLDFDPLIDHYVCANEGAAIALGTGYHLGTGKIPLIYMQNSGLGNAVNPLLSLTHSKVYAIPLLLLVGWRGEPGIEDEPQHQATGLKTQEMLANLSIDFIVLSQTEADPNLVVKRAVDQAYAISSPVAILCSKGAFAKAKPAVEMTFQQAKRTEQTKGVDPKSFSLTRFEALSIILDALSDTDLLVSTTGFCSRELFALRQEVSGGRVNDFLNVGAMGHASQIALGLALSQPNRRVICLDGDGSVIMHMGALATIGMSMARNFFHIVLNNGVHDSVGAQPTAGLYANLTSVALGCGFKNALLCERADELKQNMPSFLAGSGPALIEVRVRPGTVDNLPRPPHEFVSRKLSFMKAAIK